MAVALHPPDCAYHSFFALPLLSKESYRLSIGQHALSLCRALQPCRLMGNDGPLHRIPLPATAPSNPCTQSLHHPPDSA